MLLSELQWNMAEDPSEWNTKPLEVMKVTFPKVETTKWYKDQQLLVSQSIKAKL